ncbi:hypothetical protein [Neptunomonas phycophila]|uniref:hypothetical protein n=1 Tax=Neptunomonas phycophila TaxID=1572645 RepID=UPI0030FA4D40
MNSLEDYSDIALTPAQLKGRFPAAPPEAFTDSLAPRTLLSILADGEKHQARQIIAILGDSLRWPLQSLMGKPYHWNILNHSEKGSRGVYQLDPRHFSGDPIDDAQARRERRQVLANKSFKQALRESKRIRKAAAEVRRANEEQLDLFIKNTVDSVAGFSVRATEVESSVIDALSFSVAGGEQ